MIQMHQDTFSRHVYASVEESASPSGHGGFQTLYRDSSMISDAEDHEIVRRLQYFGRPGIVKRLFFNLSEDKLVVSQIIGIADKDRVGRRGCYIADSLVYSARLTNIDPFQVFERFHFLSTIEEARRAGRIQDSLNLGDAKQRIATQLSAADEWGVQELKKLTRLALFAKTLAERRISIALVGSEEEVTRGLQASLLAVPAPLRRYCSFDTLYDQCHSIRNYYWAVGLRRRPDDWNPIVVNATNREVETKSIDVPQTTYLRYVEFLLEREQNRQVAACRDGAFAACEFIDGREFSAEHLRATTPETLQQVYNFALPAADQRVWTSVAVEVSPELAQRIVQIMRHKLAAYQCLRGVALRKWRRDQLLGLLCDDYVLAACSAPPREEIQSLGKTLTEHDHYLLRVLLACWTNNLKQLGTILRDLSGDEYAKAVELILKHELAPTDALAVARHVDGLFAALHCYPKIFQRDFVRICESFATLAKSQHWNELTDRVRHLDQTQCRELIKGARRCGLPDGFRRAVVRRSKELDLPECAGVLAGMSMAAVEATHACWRGNLQDLRNLLAELRSGEYAAVLRLIILNEYAPPSFAFAKQFNLEFVRVCGEFPHAIVDDFTSIVRVILKSRSSHLLAHLTPHVSGLTRPQLRSVSRSIRGQQIPGEFTDAVMIAMSRNPSRIQRALSGIRRLFSNLYSMVFRRT